MSEPVLYILFFVYIIFCYLFLTALLTSMKKNRYTKQFLKLIPYIGIVFLVGSLFIKNVLVRILFLIFLGVLYLVNQFRIENKED